MSICVCGDKNCKVKKQTEKIKASDRIQVGTEFIRKIDDWFGECYHVIERNNKIIVADRYSDHEIAFNSIKEVNWLFDGIELIEVKGAFYYE